ncbi:MAG: MoaD/ThiS family protein [Spirochaetia bacterium]|nr:MoaD/ThiS family protein [Spirochaetia bacterium]
MSASSSMKSTSICVKFFGPLKDHFHEEIKFHEDSFSIIEDVFKYLIKKHPESEGLLRSSRAVVNDEFVDFAFPLSGNETVYFLPPASGG